LQENRLCEKRGHPVEFQNPLWTSLSYPKNFFEIHKKWGLVSSSNFNRASWFSPPAPGFVISQEFDSVLHFLKIKEGEPYSGNKRCPLH
jgi:hypothetical protein